MGRRTNLLSATAVAAFLAMPALAADMALPPPDFGPGHVAEAELGTGWYLRGDVGYVDYGNVRDTPYGVAVPPLNGEKFANTWSVGGGIGYQLNNWFRADATLDYRHESEFEATSSRTNYVEGYSTDRAKYESATFLVNGYVDLGNWYGVTPYVGAGVGFNHYRLAGYTGQVTCLTSSCGDPTPGASYALGPQPAFSMPTKNRYELAWALMAGAAIDVGAGLKLDLGYRYVNLGEARTNLDAFGVGTKLKSVDAHEARIGVRYMID